MTDPLLHLLQTTDSAFPVGGFAHSYGLEGLVQADVVTDAATLSAFLEETWLPLLEHVDFPLVRLATEHAMDDGALFRIDRLATACRASSESRRAQQQMGAQRLRLVSGLTNHPRLAALREALDDNHWSANWPSAWGVESACLGLPLREVLLAYGYQGLFGLLTAALKLIAIGPTESQRLLHRHAAMLADAAERSFAVTEDDIGWFTPLLDIASSRHEHAYTRIFIS